MAFLCWPKGFLTAGLVGWADRWITN